VVARVLNNFGNLGLILLFLGLFSYSVTNLWDWRAQGGIYGGTALILIWAVVRFGEIREKLRSRSVRMGGTALATLVLVVGILILLNFLNFRYHHRFDLSEGGLHALSPQTRRVLDNLDRNIEIIGFFQDDGAAGQFQSMAREYRYLSPRVSYEVVDPQKDPSKVAQFGVTRRGQIVVAAADRRETIDDLSEERLTNAIIKLTRDEEKSVYFLTGHGERALDDSEGGGYSRVRSEIEKQNYRVTSYNLAQENRLPLDAAAIVSVGPKVNFFPNEVELLTAYFVEGGNFFLLVDPESDFEMNEFLGRYGLGFADDYVVDASGLGQLFGFGAGAPLAADYADHPITRDFSGTMTIYPGVRSVLTSDSPLDYETTVLVRSSAHSWGETEIESEPIQFDPGRDREGPVPLAALATRAIESRDNDAAEEFADGDGTEGSDETAGEAVDSGTAESRIVLFGDSDFASNAYFQTSVNGDLFLNVISWLAEDTDLLSIRPRDPATRSITLTGSEGRMIFWGTVVFFPLATLVFGLAVWYRRR
jgi:ABC-type uncharacterized transport system involved in gliding motility auxiliary subunit